MFLKPAAGSEHHSLESLIRSKVVATIPLPATLQSACKHQIELMASESMYVRNTIGSLWVVRGIATRDFNGYQDGIIDAPP
jgi:hypothetical protein